MHGAVADALQQHRAGRLDEAAACYRRAIDARPDVPELHNNLGHVLTQQGRLDEAVAGIRRAIDLRPDFPQAHYNLGIALAEQGRLNEAVACYRRVIDLQSHIPEAHNSLGYALEKLGRLDAAVACYRTAIGLRADYPEAHNNLGYALGQRGELEASIACYLRAIDLRQNYPEARNNLGYALAEQRRLDAAVACYRGAIDLDPDFAEAHFNLAIVLLAQGDMATGWREYEWRWTMPEGIKARQTFAQPQWRGEPAEGRTLLIHAEQGFGDTLQFCRYGKLAASRGLRVIMQVPKSLVRLLRGLPGVDLVARPARHCRPTISTAPCSACHWQWEPPSRRSPRRHRICAPIRSRSRPGARGWPHWGIRWRTPRGIPWGITVPGSAWYGRAPLGREPASRRSTAGVHCPRTGWRRCWNCPHCTSSACKRAPPRVRRTSH